MEAGDRASSPLPIECHLEVLEAALPRAAAGPDLQSRSSQRA
jgi:hypothetical protein